MMCVGGQSGTAMFSTMSLALAAPGAPAAISPAHAPAAARHVKRCMRPISISLLEPQLVLAVIRTRR